MSAGEVNYHLYKWKIGIRGIVLGGGFAKEGGRSIHLPNSLVFAFWEVIPIGFINNN